MGLCPYITRMSSVRYDRLNDTATINLGTDHLGESDDSIPDKYDVARNDLGHQGIPMFSTGFPKNSSFLHDTFAKSAGSMGFSPQNLSGVSMSAAGGLASGISGLLSSSDRQANAEISQHNSTIAGPGLGVAKATIDSNNANQVRNAEAGSVLGTAIGSVGFLAGPAVGALTTSLGAVAGYSIGSLTSQSSDIPANINTFQGKVSPDNVGIASAHTSADPDSGTVLEQ